MSISRSSVLINKSRYCAMVIFWILVSFFFLPMSFFYRHFLFSLLTYLIRFCIDLDNSTMLYPIFLSFLPIMPVYFVHTLLSRYEILANCYTSERFDLNPDAEFRSSCCLFGTVLISILNSINFIF